VSNIPDRQHHVLSIAWAAAWAMASLGMVLSDVYSQPNRGLGAAFILGFVGWGFWPRD